MRDFPMKTVAFLSAFALAAASLGAQAGNELPGLKPKTPIVMAQGGSFAAVSSGFDAFFSNPAGYADGTGQFTLLSSTPWIYVAPSVDRISSYMAAVTGMAGGSYTSTIGLVNDIITSNGFGAGALVGAGWTGQNLGLALYALTDAYLVGRNLLGASGTLDMDVAMVIGLGFPLQLGPVSLKLGGDIRPSVRAHGILNSTTIGPILDAIQGGGDMMTALSAIPVRSGFSLALNLGALLSVGRLSAGLSVRDLNLPLGFVTTDFKTYLDTLAGGDLPGMDAGTATEVWTLPVIALGASLYLGSPSLDPWFRPVVHMELDDPVRVIRDKQSPWNLLHFGAELRLFRFLTARAGINKGYFSFGTGLDFFVMEFNAAIFTEEIGIRPGDIPRTGVSVEFALRGDFPPKRKAK